MTIILLIIALVIVAIITGKIVQSNQHSKEVAELFSISGDISNRTFNYQQLEGLPEPVQRYFKHVLKDGQPYISYVRLIHDGQFKTNPKKDWVDIKGEQYFTAKKPGFIWKGKTAMFTARDTYIAGKGRLVVSLFSLFRIVNSQGEKIDQGELLRWLGESAWFPTNFLPSENLQWSPIDSSSAKLSFNYDDISVYYDVSFNDKNEITQMRTKRYMGEDNIETWIGKFKNYKEINDVIIPTEIEAIWKLKDGNYSYVRFNIKKIEYDKPMRF
ncbi:MAG: hypothetical protein ISS28_00610 [Candidatus Cloacimonetes bacterium]|nr:hypothetical protein [Bacteroidota bacterium]MBL7085589.1 hypothetical protein [Candidatus Cloacimonadota bacterium]